MEQESIKPSGDLVTSPRPWKVHLKGNQMVLQGRAAKLVRKGEGLSKCVSKPWCALIDSPKFIKMHLNRSIKTSSILALIFEGRAPSVQHDSLQNEDEADWGVRVGELEGAVVVGKGVAVGVGDGDVLEEGEVHGVVGDGEGWELDGVDGDLGVFRFEEKEVNDDDSGRQEEQEDRGHYARGKGRPAVGGGGDTELGELVRVVLEGKPAVGGADLVGGAVAAKPQHLVLALLHCKMKMKPTRAPEQASWKELS
ncbi:hypothetical protein RJ640_021601 [Escallonia rubra]|uniref:Uncharacterized protein n=1 Tax=Escallonia rubra TaxID=112253 RepID=A0AA88REQ5_9ASTE|nr:hypothetical protein RJ640_021601 [Escallonia rubra]